jgi:hypothetical protein
MQNAATKTEERLVSTCFKHASILLFVCTALILLAQVAYPFAGLAKFFA